MRSAGTPARRNGEGREIVDTEENYKRGYTDRINIEKEGNDTATVQKMST